MELPVSYKTLRAAEYCVQEFHDICLSIVPARLIGNIKWLEQLVSSVIEKYLLLNLDIEIINDSTRVYQNFDDFDEIYTWNIYATIRHLEVMLELADYNTSPSLIDEINDALTQAYYIDKELHLSRSLKRKFSESE